MNDNKTGNYYQSSSFILKIARYIVILGLIVFLICCILIYRNDITIENIQFLTKYITLNDGSSHYYDEEFQVNTTSSSNIFMLRDNVAIVDKTGIALYELSGSKLFNYSYSYSSPATVCDLHNILIHDIEGNELSIFNSFSRVYSQKYNYGVRCADINEKGFAIITGEKGYRSALIAYNDNYNEYFRWLSEDNYLSALSLSPNGRNIAVSTVKTDNGSYKCSVKIFDTTKDEPIHTTDDFDELPLYLSYSQNGKNIYVITDSSIKFYTSTLDEITSHKFNQSKIKDYYTSNDMIIFSELNNLSGNSTKLTGFNCEGDRLFEININDDISDVAIGKTELYALGIDGVYKYSANQDGKYEMSALVPISKRYNSILCDSEDNCYITSDSSVIRVEF
ncbi:MAG: hypothetical protein J6K12_06095 [Clostridia bacterium]|nr:hypothetical protein [Clostridia bacterium]